MATAKYLIKRGQRWYVYVRVPPSLQSAVGGSSHLRESLRTTDRAVAERRKWPVITKLKTRLQELQRARRQATSPTEFPEHGDPREWADQIRRLREAGDDHQAEAIAFVAQDTAEAIEAKAG